MYYDDNFGYQTDADGEDRGWFRRHVQRNSIWKTCDDCGRRVKLMPDYGICDSCATRRENGWAY